MLVFAFAVFCCSHFCTRCEIYENELLLLVAGCVHWHRVYWVNENNAFLVWAKRRRHFRSSASVGVCVCRCCCCCNVDTLESLHLSQAHPSSFRCKYLHALVFRSGLALQMNTKRRTQYYLLGTFLTNDSKEKRKPKMHSGSNTINFREDGFVLRSRCVCVPRAHEWKWENICREFSCAQRAYSRSRSGLNEKCAEGEIICY